MPTATLRSKRTRTPTVLQMEAVECGAAALGIILGYYGRIVPLSELRQVCGVSRDGSKASKMLMAARHYGLKSVGYKSELEQLPRHKCPYIVFWDFNHFLVVEGFNRHQVYLNDPSTGPRVVSMAEFDAGYTGVVLTMEPGPQFARFGRRSSVVRALAERLQHSAGTLLYCVIAGFLLVVPGLITPVFTQVFVDNFLVRGLEDWVRPLLFGLGLNMVMIWTLKQLQLLFLRRLKIKLAVGMSGRFLWHTLRLPIGFYAQRQSGEISSRIDLNDKVAEVLSGRLATTLIGLVTLVFYVLIMITYDPVLTGIGVLLAAFNFLLLKFASRRRVDASIKLGMEYGKAQGVSISGLQSIETLKASGIESDFFARWSGFYTKALNTMQDLSIQDRQLGVVPQLLSAFTTVALLGIGGSRVIQGNLTLGMLIAFQSLMQAFQQPVNDLVELGTTIQDLVGDLNRLDDLLRHPTDRQFSEEPRERSQGRRLSGHIELRNITYGYSPLEPPLIENFNLVVKPGERVAFVGGSGSGKSTLIRLLTGLYEPWTGGVYFDGVSRQSLTRSEITHSLAMVDQDIFMFSGTVRENLTLWDIAMPDTELVRACKDAAIHETVLALPGSYDSVLLEGGANLSGGQRQRLELARALVGDPAVLVMDEATSALDVKTEHQIEQNLRRRGCTCIVVAHRLSAIRDCDEIIVLEKGKVVERGTHQSLWQAGGVYARLLHSEGEVLKEGGA
ncbi:MAG: NHLP family bacteriocin export ABC transporter peptidase/permease/ATPase subunit [Anaerolineae bacterium]|nr:NHLP family bacteriocin export ABC transporter peptidase/permease/ATPase subunit [Gloeobacterales cyanobacterium ES-bin-313]